MNSESINSQKNKRMFNIRQNFIKWWDYHDIGGKLVIWLFCVPILVLSLIITIYIIYVLRWYFLGLMGLMVFFIMISLSILLIMKINDCMWEKKKEKEREQQEKRERKEKEWYVYIMNTTLSSKEIVLDALGRFMNLDYADIKEFYDRLPTEFKYDIYIVERCMTTIYNQEVTWFRHINEKKQYVKEFYKKIPEKIKENKKIASEYINYAIPERHINLSYPNKNNYIDDENIRKCYEDNRDEYKNDIVEFINDLHYKIKNDHDIISLLKKNIIENFEIYNEYAETISSGGLVGGRHNGGDVSDERPETVWFNKKYYDGSEIAMNIFEA